ncbi:MAG: class I SAM-dependent methyltransferase [Actinomycetota bacterium]|nr:class I SAM-dependent methyltransferase [Actinomycetota bacterium]
MNLRNTDYENYDYREFWENNKRLYEDNSERIALRRLLAGFNKKDKVIFDIGCGYGRLFNEYKDFGTMVLIDSSINNLKNARRRIKKFLKNDSGRMSSVYFIASDANNLPVKPDCADVVLTVRMIHHLGNPEKYFDEVARILKNGGLYFLEFANKRNFKNILKFLAGRMEVSPFSPEPLQVGETILNFHPFYIYSLVKERGLLIKKLISISNLRINLMKKFPGTKTLLLFERMYQKLFSFITLGPSIFLKCVLGKPGHEDSCGGGKEKIENILTCASCRNGTLIFDKDTVKCRSCGRTYKKEDGIYNFKAGI